ncbi:MAG TPA: LysM peptidoglycan-binding domain-containing protein, partial [Anaerolineales bacterium]|nr:LysM peptidoglycan-binding domain-containing protein [Anaerolineales bacterium]
MNNLSRIKQKLSSAFLVFAFLLSACNLEASVEPQVPTPTSDIAPYSFAPTALPTRPTYKPGELVDYIAQNGDTLPALAARFNTTVEEIFQANPFIPREATTMPPGMPM